MTSRILGKTTELK